MFNPFLQHQYVTCPNCKSYSQDISTLLTPIGDIVYNPIFACGLCHKRYEITTKVTMVEHEYKEIN